jgi:hypothetical protein
MHKATIPSNPAELLNPIEIPVSSDKTSLPILIPRSPFPSGESTSKNNRDVTNPITNVTAAIVERDRDGRRNFVSSARTTLIITHQSFQKKYLQVIGEQG